MATGPFKALAAEPVWRPDSILPFPSVALQALNMMAGTDTSLLDLCNLIRCDAAFSTEVLKIANSPLIAFSTTITSVLQASMLLGFRRLRSVVITVGLRAYLDEPFSPALRACWRHSVACALIAEQAAHLCARDRDFAYTAGVMHDIGRVALAASMPKAYNRILEGVVDGPQNLLPAEREYCGLTHCEAGRTLVKTWGLPEIFADITSCHHDPAWPPLDGISILPLSCLLADSMGFAVTPFRAPAIYTDILRHAPEPVQRAFPPSGEQLASQIEKQIELIENV